MDGEIEFELFIPIPEFRLFSTPAASLEASLLYPLSMDYFSFLGGLWSFWNKISLWLLLLYILRLLTLEEDNFNREPLLLLWFLFSYSYARWCINSLRSFGPHLCLCLFGSKSDISYSGWIVPKSILLTLRLQFIYDLEDFGIWATWVLIVDICLITGLSFILTLFSALLSFALVFIISTGVSLPSL